MFRILLFFLILLPVALALNYLADQPGAVTITVAGKAYETSLLVGAVGVVLLGLLLMAAWSLVSFSFKLPGLISIANKVRRRSNGIAAISRGMIAVGSGDARIARQQAKEAERLLGREPLTLLLKAQAAQLSGERSDAEAAFSTMLDSPDTRVLGLRGLFVEARRRNDTVAARAHAEEAHTLAPTVPWASRAALEYASLDRDWPRAIAAVERSAGRNVVTRSEARRLKAVLMTAQAEDMQERSSDEALRLSLAALKVEPGLVPAALIAGRRLSDKADYGRASKVLEAAFKLSPHPDLAEAYLDVRRGDSALDRMKRARVLARARPGREARFIVARAALDAREFRVARENLEALVLDKVTARAALMMAELEEMEHGRSGPAREWLARASRAPRDPVWVADGFVSERWSPVSPVDGRIDAFEWREPPQAIEASMRAEMDAERLAHAEPRETTRAIAASADKGGLTATPMPASDPAPASALVPDAEELAMIASADAATMTPAAPPPAAGPAASATFTPPMRETRTGPSREGGGQRRFARQGAGVEAASTSDKSSGSDPVRGRRPRPIVFPVAHAPDDPGA